MALLFLLLVAVMVWALVEVAQADRALVRLLPKWLWMAVIILVAPFGPIAWFWLGRPREGTPPPPRVRRPRVDRPAPDDDPEFLARLKAQAAQQRRLRALEQEMGSSDSGPDGEPDADRPPSGPGV